MRGASGRVMKYKLFFWTVSLVAVVVSSSCAPATEASIVTEPSIVSTATKVPTSAAHESEPTAEPTQAVQPLATSRGPNLEATDPATVELASGQLQLVEFF